MSEKKARNVLIILDTSASMYGKRMDISKTMIKELIEYIHKKYPGTDI